MPQIEGPFPVHLIKIKEFKNVINDDDVCDPYVQLTLGKESQTSDVKVDAGGEVEFNQRFDFNKQAGDHFLVITIWDGTDDGKKDQAIDEKLGEKRVDLRLQDLKAGKELPITIEKNIANSQGKMVPMKVGVCMIGLGANFRAGSGSKTSAAKMSLTEAKAADEKLEGESVNKEPMEVLVGFSNTPIDPQTCMMLGLPLGSMWGENASSVREEYLREKQKAVESTIQPVMSAQMIPNTQSFPVMVSQVTSMPAVPPQAPAFQYQNVSFPYQSTASTVYPMTTGPAAVPQSFQAMSSASTATEARVSPVVRPVVGPEVVQKQPVLKAAPVPQEPSKDEAQGDVSFEGDGDAVAALPAQTAAPESKKDEDTLSNTGSRRSSGLSMRVRVLV